MAYWCWPLTLVSVATTTTTTTTTFICTAQDIVFTVMIEKRNGSMKREGVLLLYDIAGQFKITSVFSLTEM